MKKLSQHLTELSGKKVIVRCNFDVPIEDGVVQDTTRIEDAISTIKVLIENKCQVILVSHAGRPDGQPKEEFSLRAVLPVLNQLLSGDVAFADYKEDVSQVEISAEDPVTLVENLRFWSEEESNDLDFAKALSTLGEVYVNQAFANCHRAHASMVGLPKLLPSFAGINLAEEVEILSKVRTNPDKPLISVIGGAKLETKEPLVEAFTQVADKILVGGKIALDIQENEKEVPDNVVLAELSESGRDITQESAEKFAEIIKNAKTIMWNGTMGVFEEPENQLGTRIVAEAINNTPAYTLVGGGDTEAALTVLDMEDGVDFISTGGGAMLTFLSEGELVALKALEEND